jgi:uncharacterized protein involved in type VI secretion and phage assembly
MATGENNFTAPANGLPGTDLPGSTSAVNTEALEQQALQMGEQAAIGTAEKVIAAQSQQAAKTVAQLKQGAQYAQQGAGIAKGLSGNNSPMHKVGTPGFNGNAGMDNAGMNDAPPEKSISKKQEEARERAASLGITPHMITEITVGGKAFDKRCSFELHEECDRHHSFSLTFSHDNSVMAESVPLFDVMDFTGQRISITFYPKNIPGAGKHIFNGIITRAYKTFSHDPYGSFILEGYSATYLLDDKRTRTMKSWYRGNIAKIISELTEPIKKACNTTVVPTPKNVKSVEWICQYNETPYQFMRRMAYDFGEFFYFDGVNLCYGRPDESKAPIKVVYGQDCQDLQIGFELKAVGQSHLAWSSGEGTKMVKEAPESIDGLSGFADQVYQKSQKTFAKGLVPSPFRASQGGMLEIGVKSHAAAEAANMYRVSATSSRHELRIGAIIHLFTNKVDENYKVQSEDLGYFIVTKVVHSMEGNGEYNNHFEAIPANTPMLPMENIEYPVAEAQPATVMFNDDPLNQGRIRVKFHWSTGDKGITDWIKVLTPDAGGSDKVSKNRGLVTIPDVKDIVMVDFRYGQPDQPFVTGSMHTGTKASGGGQDNHTKSLIGRSGAAVTIHDGHKSLQIKDGKGNTVHIHGNGEITIQSSAKVTVTTKDIVMNASNDVTISAGNNLTLNGSNVSINAATGKDGSGGMLIAKAQKNVVVQSTEDSVNIMSNAKDIIFDAKVNLSAKAETQITINSGDTQIF